jgi:hypothetical protein
MKLYNTYRDHVLYMYNEIVILVDETVAAGRLTRTGDAVLTA